ncbi:MAG: phosphate uptake regulator PhoU [Candidatus Thorarchaeota archaeon]
MTSTTTRKLNKVRNSFYVYLPKQWCDKYNLNQDSEVKIKETGEGTLTVFPPDFQHQKSSGIRFNIDKDFLLNLQNILIGAYVVGATKLELNFSKSLDMAERQEISQSIRRLPGFEILEEHSNSISIRDTSEKQMVVSILKRQFATTKYMLSELVAGIATEDYSDAQHILMRDEDVDRHRYFVERLCHLALRDPSYARKIGIPPSDCLHFSLAAKYVERMADHVCGAVEHLCESTLSLESIAETAKYLLDVYNRTKSAFFANEGAMEQVQENGSVTYKTEETFEALHAAEAIAEKLSKMGTEPNGLEAKLALLLLHMERIASYCSDVGEVAINRSIEVSIENPQSD